MERLHLRGRHQPGVIVLVSGERQAIAFDRIGDETNRPVVIDAVEGGDDRTEIMPAKIVHQSRQLDVTTALQERGDRSPIADLTIESLAPGRSTLKHQS